MGNVVGRRAGHVRAGIIAVSLLFSCVGLVTLGSSVAQAAPAGVDWTSRTSAADNQWNTITWGGPEGSELFVALANNGANRLMTSPDGVTWTSRTSPTAGWNSVTWGDDTFVAVGNGGEVMTSTDGITWTSRTPAGYKTWKSVTWGGPAGQEKFVVVSDTLSNASGIMTSADGVTWTYRTAAGPVVWTSVAWGDDTFVSVTSNPTSNKVMTSVDGITWTARAGAGPNNTAWKSVAWGGTSGNEKFVAVAESGSGNRVMTSPDGINWTIQTEASTNAWTSVAWGGPVGDQTFVAVANTGTGNRVMTSPDGITWTSQTSASNNDWTSVAWGGTSGGGMFAAVSRTGTGNRVMTSASTLTPPGAPVITGVVPGESSAAVAFTADDSGGSVITRLEFALDDTSAVDDSTASLSSPYTLSNLSPGTAYTVHVRAVNALGTGPWSSPQVFVTSSPPNPVVYPPGAPTSGIAVAADRSVSVSWTAPADSGSYPISTYQVTSAPGGRSCLVAVPALTCTVSGLTNGTSYTFTVRALNGAGWGASSDPSNAVIPHAAPKPSIVITGSRDAADTRVVRVSGTTTGLVGEQVTPWLRFTEQTTFMEGTGVRTVAADGTFAWSRATGKKVHVYFAHGSIKSNTVVIAAR